MSNSFLRNSTYALLDLVTFKKGITRNINDFKIRFPARWSRYYESDYEKENYTFLKKQVKTGMHIIDIGAHIGLFSTCASQLAGPSGKVICFEPTPGTFKILSQTLKLNNCKNVTPVQAAVSDKVGSATFYVSSDYEGNNSNSLVEDNPHLKMSGYDVKVESIDNVVKAYAITPSIIKIDVEGTELDTLHGGLETFSSFKPILILGLHPEAIQRKGDSLEAIWNVLIKAGYQIEKDGKVITQTDFCSRKLLFDVNCFV
jgi:FkbM family methyltransferase